MIHDILDQFSDNFCRKIQTYSARLLLVAMVLCVCGCNESTKSEDERTTDADGIIFRGNDYIPDNRTSMLIQGSDQHLIFRDGLEISFKLKIRQKGDQYGNICTVVVDNKPIASLILTTTHGASPALCLVGSDVPMQKIEGLQESIYAWQRVDLKLIRNGNDVEIYVGEKEHEKVLAPNPESLVRIFMGRSPIDDIPSIDVAPFELKDLEVITTTSSGKELVSTFDLNRDVNDSIILSNNKELTARLYNPIWIYDTHSHWTLVNSMSFNGRVFSVYNRSNGNLYLIASNQVVRINLMSNRTRSWTTSQQDISILDNQFMVIESNNQDRLFFYNTDSITGGKIVDFDFDKGEWTDNLTKIRDLEFTHQNSQYIASDSSIIRMFGYGHHRYRSDIHKISMLDGEITSVTTSGDTISPRYMAATSIQDSIIFVYGGVGNARGNQEYGTKVFNDLYKINTKSMDTKLLWSMPTTRRGLVPAQSMILDESDGRGLMLMYSPFKAESFLVLKELDLSNGEMVSKADSIPYVFNDMKSWADLLVSPKGDELYALTENYDESKDAYEVKLYNISLPIVSSATPVGKKTNSTITLWLTIVIIVCVLVISIVIILNRNKRHEIAESSYNSGSNNEVDIDNSSGQVLLLKDMQREHSKPGIYLINDFGAIASDKLALTDQFSPILRQLLVLIAVYSVRRQNGISNSELKDFLWSDKSQESFVNNRSVNIRKIRMLLGKIGGLDIVSSNGIWRLDASNVSMVDFYDIMNAVEECESCQTINEALINRVIKYARLGPLFPYMHNYWLDTVKAQYSDRIINVLHRILDDLIVKNEFKRQIEICDILLGFDSIDEKAIQVKCNALINTKRMGLANATYKQFVREYESMIGEQWQEPFEQFVRKS